jgi:glucan biosynthesis protein C
MNTQTANKSAKPGRRWDIDWLRVLAVLLLFPFHTGMIFHPQWNWYIKNNQLSNALSYLLSFVHPWHMPLLFTLAGGATWFALRKRSGGQYAVERFKRLLIPFIFGLLVLIPPQSYYGLRNHSDYAESFQRFYPHFFKMIPEDMDGFFLGGFTFGHLWFISYLFVFSLVALPLFLLLKRETGERLIRRLAAFFTLPGTILLLAIPIYVMDRLIDFDPDPLYYITFFIYGYILMADARFGEAIDMHKGAALILGPVVLALALRLAGERPWPAGLPDWIEPIVDVYYNFGFASWFTILALLGYGRLFLSFSNRFLRYFGEASYPLYILHQTVIVVIGYYVLQWGTWAGLGVKFVTVLVVAFVATVVLYDLLVKRTNVTRFVFGMRTKKRPVEEKRLRLA